MARIRDDYIEDLLLDTHILFWLATTPERLPEDMRKAIVGATRRFVSLMSALEIQIKHSKNPKALPFSLNHFELAMNAFSCREIPVSFQDIKALDNMEFFQPDPFDRLIMAQAANRKICLVTLDQNIIRTAKHYKAFTVLAA